MFDQQRSSASNNSSQKLKESAKAAANFVPGASLFVLATDASGMAHIEWVDDNDNEETTSEGPLENQHTPNEKSRLLLTNVNGDTPPFVACFAFCFALNIMLACVFLGIFITYLHYRFGFTTPEYEMEGLCSFMRTWNQKLLWLIVATCALGVVDFVKFCLALAQQEDYNTIPQQQELQGEGTKSAWKMIRTLLKWIIDVLFLVWMIQAFWETNYHVSGAQECPNMYMFTHIYSTIMTVLLVLGIVASLLLWSVVMLRGYREPLRRESGVSEDDFT